MAFFNTSSFLWRPFKRTICTNGLNKSAADVFDEILRVALVRVVDDELSEEESGSVRAMRAEH